MALTLSGGISSSFVSGGITYQVQTFTGSGNLYVAGTGTLTAQVLLVGGGGGGSEGCGGTGNNAFGGNGGGAGGVFYTSSYTFLATDPTWSVTVGKGGSGGTYNSPATPGGTTIIAASASLARAVVSSSYADHAFFQLTGSILGTFHITSSLTQVDAAPNYYVVTGSTAALTTAAVRNKINSLSSSFDITAASVGTTLTLVAFSGSAGNNYKYVSGSITQSFASGGDAEMLTGSYGGVGGRPNGGNGGSGGGGVVSGSKLFVDLGFPGGLQVGRGEAGAGGGGAANSGSSNFDIFYNPFTIHQGGNGGNGVALTIQNGTPVYYAGGGAGGGWVNVGPGAGGLGGLGGGGNGGSGVKGAGVKGAANTGAGGGGGALSDQASNWGDGGDGGSGIVVIIHV